MKKLLLGCAGLALFASVMSVMLWRDLRDERALNAELQVRLTEAEARPLPSAAAPAPAARPAVPVAAANKGNPEPAGTAAFRPEPAASNFVPAARLSERDMLKDPEYRKARLTQLRLQLPAQYPDLAEELGLAPEQLDRFFDMLAENALELSASYFPAVGPNGQVDQVRMQEMQRQQQELRAKQDAAINAMLGDTRMARWRNYQQTQMPRQQVMQLDRTLQSLGAPLTAAQRRPLVEAMAAELTRQQQEQRDMRTTLQGPASQMDPQTRARLQEENLNRQAESNRRMIDALSAHLNPRQLELYRSQLESQLTVSRMTSRMLREAAEQNRTEPPVIVTAPVVEVAVPVEGRAIRTF